MRLLVLFFFVCYFLVGCQANNKAKNQLKPQSLLQDFETPTKRLDVDEYPNFEDDLDFAGLALAIERQLVRYNQRNLNGTIQLGDIVYPQRSAISTLERILELSEGLQRCLGPRPDRRRRRCYRQLQRSIESEFYVFAPDLNEEDPRHGEDKPTLFTGYYTPLIEGSHDKSMQNPHAIYAKPSDPGLRASTRQQIDFQDRLAGRGLELFYAPDLFDLYLLHVEGGGKVEVEEDGEERGYYISYDGTNRQSFRFISSYMKEMGYIDGLSVSEQRRFLEENPDKAEEIYSTCPSYVYFKVTEDPPLGSDLVSLTDRRSIATDRNYYKFKGLLSFVKTKRPSESRRRRNFINYSRFYLDQDTGGAIRGKARVDIYFGEGDYAERAAHIMKQRGDVYFLMLKPATHKK